MSRMWPGHEHFWQACPIPRITTQSVFRLLKEEIQIVETRDQETPKFLYFPMNPKRNEGIMSPTFKDEKPPPQIMAVFPPEER